MRKKRTLLFTAILLLLHSSIFFQSENSSVQQAMARSAFEHSEQDVIRSLYRTIDWQGKLPSFSVFSSGLRGFMNLKTSGTLKSDLLTLIDFTLSSAQKRLWIIDLSKQEVRYHTLVAHGRNTGWEYAKKFSNQVSSYQSSMGFYVTGDTYIGKHGLSLYLHGQERGFNDKALERAIVMHGAHYVSDQFVKQHGRLGRSLGCPAVPYSHSDDIVKLVSGGSCMFIYYPDRDYLSRSELLNRSPDLAQLPAFLLPRQVSQLAELQPVNRQPFGG